MTGYIYKIVNSINDKVYIGQTRKTLEQRFLTHLNEAKCGTDRPLYRAIRKYGADKFSIHLVEECDVEMLNQREIYWIEEFHGYSEGYNAALGGLGVGLFDYEEIWSLLQAGKSIAEIKDLIGCGKDTIYTVARLHDFVISAKTTKKKTDTVLQFTKDGALLRSFTDSHEAMQWCIDNGHSSQSNSTIGSSHIRACCNNKRKTAYGFVWKYK